MRIVQALGWYFPEDLGGTEVYVAGLARRLRARGNDVRIAAPDPRNEVERSYVYDDVPVYRYPIPRAPSREACQEETRVQGTERFHAWLTRERPDVVHFHTFVTGLGLSEVKAAKALGARVIVTTHSARLGYVCQRGTMMRWGERLCDGVSAPVKCAACALHERGLPRPLAWAVAAAPGSSLARHVRGRGGTALAMRDLISRNQARQRELLASVDKLVVLTEWALEAVAENGAPREKLALNRLGLSQARLERKPGPASRPTTTPIKIGYLGRFDVIKGIHDLARAVVALPREVPVRVELRGPSDPAAFSKLVAIAVADPRITFAPPVSPDEVLDVLSGYDVLCCPSVALEGGPTVAIEAHAVGTPVVGTRAGGLAELVTDGRNGRLVPPGDWRALGEVIRETAGNPAGTIDRWRLELPKARTMDEVAADYVALYEASA